MDEFDQPDQSEGMGAATALVFAFICVAVAFLIANAIG